MERVLVTMTLYFAWEYEASDGMAADAMPSTFAAHAETKVARSLTPRNEKAQKKQLAPCGEPGVFLFDSDEDDTHVLKQQVVVRIDVLEVVRVTDFVCKVESS